ncbi:MAG: hypothetical protein LWW99_03960 [Deltaproteobacteria bacterium]|nr:hypothetical protein [Deltaproteobacteria bacterium]
MFDIFLTDEAGEQLDRIKIDRGLSKRYKAVKKAIEFLSRNPRHRGLQTHEFTSLKGSKRKSNHHYCKNRFHWAGRVKIPRGED